ncbi:DUF2182 domain-containing protein [Hoyosella sp. YIM 151337]|uniref:DUF2182 domain-containing protein n=1 Tax=Hoyosella sp. YIM 151337 TaxID=2992742 RepID=UPI0022354E36|nr:DUF2182 domain-containing protein [Hoyosella sp. YIM 151337]MCW4353544.1 DUF2182 domain-containing protein [Hoyosella sp. YIM 151337]
MVEVTRRDTPRTAYSVLERRATIAIAAALLLLAAIAWWRIIALAPGMDGMTMGLAAVGAAMPFDMGVFVFLGMWTTMMVAMMFPTVAPIVLLHRMVMRRAGHGVSATVVFGAGYLTIWAVTGLVPLVMLVAFRDVAHGTAWIATAAGIVLVIAGLYQFTPWKQTCLHACRTPLTFLATHNFGASLSGAFRAGASHGLYCLGCCWALMAVLFVVGLMNLVWMAGIALIFLVEKHLSRDAWFTRVVGTAVALFGVVVLAQPHLLEVFTPEMPAMTM